MKVIVRYNDEIQKYRLLLHAVEKYTVAYKLILKHKPAVH